MFQICGIKESRNSIVGLPVVPHTYVISELQQHMDDILRFHSHSDPQLSASIGLAVGQYIRASLIHGCGQYNDMGRPSLALSSLLEILCKVSTLFAFSVHVYSVYMS